jgi:hypothetical protein
MDYEVRLLRTEAITHDTRHLVLERPTGYEFEEGQAAEIALDRANWRDECRPFSFTSPADNEHLEFIVKIYAGHEGVTKQIGTLSEGAKLFLSEPFGTIRYKGEGYFIAGGTGITPFIAILRKLARDGLLGSNKLLYTNRTKADIILKPELDKMLGGNVVYNLTHEPKHSFKSGLIDEQHLDRHAPDADRHFYLCGPDEMVRDLRDILTYRGVSRELIVFEE